MTARQVSEAGMRWYRTARFGMFVHWGLYSVLGRGEWDMFESRTDAEAYAQLADRFSAQEFDARDWARLARDAGQRYVTVTTRHHDGFSLYDTALSDFKVTRTPFGRDPLAELAAACAEQGLRLGVYVSLIDWHHPAFRAGQSSPAAWQDYLGFLHGQVEELCTQYGDLAQVWFDGDWPDSHWAAEYPEWFGTGGGYDYPRLYDTVHRLQPDAVLLNNHKSVPLAPGEDVQGFEQDLPGENTAGFNTAAVLDVPKETCLTMNKTWGYCPDDHDYKTAETVVALLKRAWSSDTNVLLNVGPDAEGRIPQAEQDTLRRVGTLLGQAA